MISRSSGGCSAIVYPGLFDSVTDVRLSALTNGVKENIIVNQYTGQHSYEYILRTQGLSAELSGKEILMYDENGQMLAKIDAPNMTDANGVYSTKIAVSLRGSAGEYRVIYTPDEEWMKNAAYPVMIDPTGSYQNQLATGIGDAFVSSSDPNKHFEHMIRGSGQQDHDRTETNLYAGKKGGSVNYAYIIPSLRGFEDPTYGGEEFPVDTNLLILEATWEVYVHEVTGSGNFNISLVTSDWNTSTVTYNGRPSHSATVSKSVRLHTGWNTIDVTHIFSAWFNALDQKQNRGFVVSSSDSWARICASDISPKSERMRFSAKYYTGVGKPKVTVSAGGNGINSQSGWVELQWNRVTGAKGYALGIYNGKAYEYRYLGDVTSFSTKGKGLWATDAEMAEGKYALHWDGGGQELPNIPSVNNSDLNYYFRVVPTNEYGQAAGSSTATTVSVLLPDTTPPSMPVTLSVSPAGYSNADEREITWAGIQDMPSGSSSLGENGKVEYVLNPEGSDPAAWAWASTGSSSANGSFVLPTEGMEDGVNVVYVRGVDTHGNYGQSKGAEVKVDKTPPTAPDITLLPEDWTNEITASLTWSSIMDVNDLLRVEYAFDDAAYTSTDLADKSYTGYVLDIAALADGEHSVSVRGVDSAGNLGAAAEAVVKVDRSAPTVSSSTLEPTGWSDAKEIKLSWQGATDPYSGIASIEYAIDQSDFISLPVEENGNVLLDVSSLDDGQHTVSLRLTDQLGNSRTIEHTMLLDTKSPEVKLLSPADGDWVTGVLDIWGSIADISLTTWKLRAVGASGKTVEVKQDSSERENAQLGVLNTEEFADGETIELVLTASDAAGHTSTARGVFVKANHTANPIAHDVTIISPAQGEVVQSAYMQAVYDKGYEGSETANSYAIDGNPSGAAAQYKFPLYPILYPENSVHSLSVISEDRNHVLHYSQGLATTLILSDIWKDQAKLESSSGVTMMQDGALLDADSGYFISVNCASARPVLAIRLHALETPANGGSITYEYSLDNGTNWQPIRQGYDQYFSQPQSNVKIRVTMKGAGTVLNGLDVTGVYEMNPVRFKVQLLRPVRPLIITNDSKNTAAMPEMTTNAPASLATKRLYVDGLWNSDSFVADMLPFGEKSSHSVVALGIDGNGVLYGSGAATSILLRTAPDATDVYESGKLALSKAIYAIRLETLCMDRSGNVVEKGTYAYSLDGVTWVNFASKQYALLPSATKTIYLRAKLPAGVTLRGVHLEGVTATGKDITTELIKAPYHVQAADYGDYYENEKLRRYVLTWTDPNRDDRTYANEVWFDIYRNNQYIGSTQSTRYEDTDYQEDAEYAVSARRVYEQPKDGLDHILTRRSKKVQAEYVYIPAEQRLEGVIHNVADYTQSEYLNDLYGGNYTFSTTANPPSAEFALDQSLLGPHRFCSLGFEPINFNTGNFFLQTRDYALTDLGNGGFDIVRTYNSQSAETDGPFGARWATEYSQHLRLFSEGSVAYRRADGSEIIFYRQEDSSFISNTTEYEQLSYDDACTEYRITLTDGTVYAFASGGLLSRIEKDGGQHVLQIKRDEDGLITSIISPSHEELTVRRVCPDPGPPWLAPRQKC